MNYEIKKAAFHVCFFAVLAALILVYCGGPEVDGGAMNLAKMIPDKFDGFKAVGNIESYNRQTIFDYIDGAGEVYLLYDFKDVAVKKLLGPDSTEITVEIFDMGSSNDAFGIFSHSRQGNDIGIGGGSDFRDGFLCFWKNRYFVCAYSSKQAASFNDTIIALGKDIASRILRESDKPDILGILPEDGLIESSPIYFHKQTSLNYHYFISEENILNLDKNTEAVIANYEPDRMTLLCIKYPRPDLALESYDNFVSNYIPEAKGTGAAKTEDGKWVRVLNVGHYFIAVFDAPNEESATLLVDKVIENIARTPNE
jgi:hypothetical protein